jgi:hypothetical protein
MNLYFAQLKLDKELDTISWPNDVDIIPEYLYLKTSLNYKNNLKNGDI